MHSVELMPDTVSSTLNTSFSDLYNISLEGALVPLCPFHRAERTRPRSQPASLRVTACLTFLLPMNSFERECQKQKYRELELSSTASTGAKIKTWSSDQVAESQLPEPAPLPPGGLQLQQAGAEVRDSAVSLAMSHEAEQPAHHLLPVSCSSLPRPNQELARRTVGLWFSCPLCIERRQLSPLSTSPVPWVCPSLAPWSRIRHPDYCPSWLSHPSTLPPVTISPSSLYPV